MESRFKLVYEPPKKHLCGPIWSCEVDRPEGTVIQCEECGQLWILIFDGPHRVKTWVKPTKRQDKKLRKSLDIG